MPRLIVLDEIHLSLRIRADLKISTANRIQRILQSKQFMTRLRSAIRQAIAATPALKEVRVNLSR
ncbi:MAG TPA: hypothetical protein VGI99_15720 [Gemmataceae bacterium]